MTTPSIFFGEPTSGVAGEDQQFERTQRTMHKIAIIALCIITLGIYYLYQVRPRKVAAKKEQNACLQFDKARTQQLTRPVFADFLAGAAPSRDGDTLNGDWLSSKERESLIKEKIEEEGSWISGEDPLETCMFFKPFFDLASGRRNPYFSLIDACRGLGEEVCLMGPQKLPNLQEVMDHLAKWGEYTDVQQAFGSKDLKNPVAIFQVFCGQYFMQPTIQLDTQQFIEEFNKLAGKVSRSDGGYLAQLCMAPTYIDSIEVRLTHKGALCVTWEHHIPILSTQRELFLTTIMNIDIASPNEGEDAPCFICMKRTTQLPNNKNQHISEGGATELLAVT